MGNGGLPASSSISTLARHELDELVGIPEPPAQELGDEVDLGRADRTEAVFHSTELMFSYHTGRIVGIGGVGGTSPTGRLMTTELMTSTGMSRG